MMEAAWKSWEPPSPGQDHFLWNDNRCAMCGPLHQRYPVLDHCHETGLVRGYLCHSCNVSEARSDAPHWLAWRAWDNPARAYGWPEVYFGRDGTPIGIYSPMNYMSQVEKETWWAEQIAAASEGRDWPAPLELSEEGKAREAAMWQEQRRIAEMIATSDW